MGVEISSLALRGIDTMFFLLFCVSLRLFVPFFLTPVHVFFSVTSAALLHRLLAIKD